MFNGVTLTDFEFSSLSLPPAQLSNLADLGYARMTPIQVEALPHLLKNKDLIAQAKTGSGKTAAFGIGLLAKLNVRQYQVQSLIICPTRELAKQVAQEIKRLARFQQNIKVLTLCGGSPFGPQLGSLEHGAHIVVGTPGRIKEHLRKGSLSLDKINTLVLDEADRMLDMGFHDAISDIIENTPKSRQTLLFSATYPEGIQGISNKFQRNPIEVSVEAVHSQNDIEQLFYEVKKHERNNALLGLLKHYQPQSTVIFCNTKAQCKDLTQFLREHDADVATIHGDLEQWERDQVLVQFANKSRTILVATDVAARGLDIKDLQAVINYEISRDPEIHIHRIGRTGRAGKKGLALSLYTESEQYKLNAIEELLNKPVRCDTPASLDIYNQLEMIPTMVTMCIDGGRKSKVRAGDVLGALTGDVGLSYDSVGKIDIFEHRTYVAINRNDIDTAVGKLSRGTIKGRHFKVKKLR